jgi:hypothetical protein
MPLAHVIDGWLGVLPAPSFSRITPCADHHPSPPPTHWQLQVPRRESSPFLFHFSTISTPPAAMLRSTLARASRSSAAVIPSGATRTAFPRAAPVACQLQQTRQAHAISNPTLSNIEKRWEDMPPQEQADLWMSLRDRMKVDWKEMTMQEKKAGAYPRFWAQMRVARSRMTCWCFREVPELSRNTNASNAQLSRTTCPPSIRMFC